MSSSSSSLVSSHGRCVAIEYDKTRCLQYIDTTQSDNGIRKVFCSFHFLNNARKKHYQLYKDVCQKFDDWYENQASIVYADYITDNQIQLIITILRKQLNQAKLCETSRKSYRCKYIHPDCYDEGHRDIIKYYQDVSIHLEKRLEYLCNLSIQHHEQQQEKNIQDQKLNDNKHNETRWSEGHLDLKSQRLVLQFNAQQELVKEKLLLEKQENIELESTLKKENISQAEVAVHLVSNSLYYVNNLQPLPRSFLLLCSHYHKFEHWCDEEIERGNLILKEKRSLTKDEILFFRFLTFAQYLFKNCNMKMDEYKRILMSNFYLEVSNLNQLTQDEVIDLGFTLNKPRNGGIVNHPSRYLLLLLCLLLTAEETEAMNNFTLTSPNKYKIQNILRGKNTTRYLSQSVSAFHKSLFRVMIKLRSDEFPCFTNNEDIEKFRSWAMAFVNDPDFQLVLENGLY